MRPWDFNIFLTYMHDSLFLHMSKMLSRSNYVAQTGQNKNPTLDS